MVKVDFYRAGDAGPCPPTGTNQASKETTIIKRPDGEIMEGQLVDGKKNEHRPVE